MLILFCNDSFPGHFEPLASYFASMPENDVLFASRYERRDFSLPGVRRVQFRAPKDRSGQQQGDVLVHSWSRAVAIGRQAYSSFQQLARLNFEPDLALFSAGNGVSLFLERAFPRAFRVAYLDSSLAHMDPGDPDIRAASLMVQGASLFESHMAFALSSWQRDAIPQILQPSIGLVPLSVDTAFFSPEAAQPFAEADGTVFSGGEMVSISIKSSEGLLESGLLRVITALLLRRPKCSVHLSCGFSGGMQFLQRYFSGLEESCLSRLHISDFLKRSDYRDMLCASAVHVCPSKPSSMLVEMLETMSCGSVLLCYPSDPALVSGRNMVAWPETPQKQFECVSRVLDREAARRKIGANARRTVLEKFRQDEFLPLHAQTLINACRQWQEEQKEHAGGSSAMPPAMDAQPAEARA